METPDQSEVWLNVRRVEYPTPVPVGSRLQVAKDKAGESQGGDEGGHGGSEVIAKNRYIVEVFPVETAELVPGVVALLAV